MGQKKICVHDLARRSGVSEATVSSILHGRNGVSLYRITRLASILGVTPNYFIR